MSNKQKNFGKHVIAFHGKVNDGPLRPMIAVNLSDAIDDPCIGDEWLTPTEAERLGKQLLKAAAYIRASEKQAQSRSGTADAQGET